VTAVAPDADDHHSPAGVLDVVGPLLGVHDPTREPLEAREIGPVTLWRHVDARPESSNRLSIMGAGGDQDSGHSPPGGTLVLRPLARGDEADLLRIHTTPEVMRWWDVPADGFPWDEPESTRWTIVLDGGVAGLIQFSEEPEPKYRHATIDLFLDPALHGRGWGTEAVRRVIRHLIDDRDHHRITIDPALDNAAAIRAYEKAGFRRVGVTRCAERDVGGDGWHDSLLMELLAGEER
jgi:RimJ/RimL family protein N-acetyltransferase